MTRGGTPVQLPSLSQSVITCWPSFIHLLPVISFPRGPFCLGSDLLPHGGLSARLQFLFPCIQSWVLLLRNCLCFMRQGVFRRVKGLLTWLGWLARDPQGAACLYLPNVGFMNMATRHSFLHRFGKIKLRSSCLWATSTSPTEQLQQLFQRWFWTSLCS